MALGVDRYASRADTFVFLGCLLLSFVAMSLPEGWRDRVARQLRPLLMPFVALQEQSDALRLSRTRLETVTAQRDSAVLAASFLLELRSENTRLRSLLGLSERMGWGYVAGEVLHQAEPTDPFTVLVSAGRNRGVRPLSAVVSPEGLVGVVRTVDARTSVVLTWAHPDFRASAMAADGSVYGIVAPRGSRERGTWLLELSGVAYRKRVAPGTLILTSGRGGVFPRGVPLGTVIDVVGEAEGWETTYLVQPVVQPAAVSHVMILTAQRAATDVGAAFPRSDSGR